VTARGAVAVIPVRLGSARLPGKALLAATGLPLFVHTANQARAAECFDEVVVATDSQQVVDACKAHELRPILTSESAPSGSARCAEALADLDDPAVVVDVQGDWPEVSPSDLRALVTCLVSDPEIPIATLSCRLDDVGDFDNPHVVKLVIAGDGRALYFSRAAIPGSKAAFADEPASAADTLALARRHLGVYGFQARTLASLATIPDSPLEAREGLEQLRWLAAGLRIQVIASSGSPRGIETRADYDAFVDRTRSRAGRP
jgi:3-deoxy-manno-octulosonate cytidylyltransferase (CMP-KDO synthetase)